MHPGSFPENTVPPTERRAFRINEAAALLGISRSTIYKLAAEGQVRLVKIAGRTLVPAT